MAMAGAAAQLTPELEAALKAQVLSLLVAIADEDEFAVEGLLGEMDESDDLAPLKEQALLTILSKQFLLQQKNITAKTANALQNQSPLSFATLKSDPSTLRALLDGFAKARITDLLLQPCDILKTPGIILAFLLAPESFATIFDLVAHPALQKRLVNTKCLKNDDSLLHVAITEQVPNLVTIRLLLKMGADLYARNAQGLTPAELAAKNRGITRLIAKEKFHRVKSALKAVNAFRSKRGQAPAQPPAVSAKAPDASDRILPMHAGIQRMFIRARRKLDVRIDDDVQMAANGSAFPVPAYPRPPSPGE
jgi:hypothetical protein